MVRLTSGLFPDVTPFRKGRRAIPSKQTLPWISGGPGGEYGDRTRDLLLARQALYQTELTPHVLLGTRVRETLEE